MPKYEPLSPMSGADALVSLLAFLQDRKAVETRLRELEQLHAEINGAIARLGKAEEIESLHAAALEQRRKATEEHRVAREAREKGAAAIAAAVAVRETALGEAGIAQQTIASARALLAKEREDWKVEEAQQKEAIRLLRADAQRLHDSAQARDQAAAEAGAEWAEKLERLTAAGIILREKP